MPEQKHLTNWLQDVLASKAGKTMDEMRAAHRERMAEHKQMSEQRKLAEIAEKEHKALQIRLMAEEQRRELFRLVANLVRKHLATLTRKYFQLTSRDDYGIVSYDKWDKEKNYFIENLIYPSIPSRGYHHQRDDIEKMLDEMIAANAQTYSDRELNIEILNGVDYEFLCAELLMSAGWKTSLTKSSGDQGVDVIAEKGSVCLALQCKKYSFPVGNSAVQEIYAGMRFVHATHGAVISNAPFTPQAQQLASSTNVLLLHHTDLANIDNLISGV